MLWWISSPNSWVVGICGSGDVAKCRFMNKNRPEEGKWLESHTVFNCINDFFLCCSELWEKRKPREKALSTQSQVSECQMEW